MLKVRHCFLLLLFIAALTTGGNTTFAQSLNFSYTGSFQTYTVPVNISSISVDISGAKGGGTTFSRGGYGGRVQCILAVTPGDVLYINIGGQGPASSTTGVRGGYNGGGSGSEDGGGGGGASDIRRNGTALSDRVIIAGGGGGACGAASVSIKDYDRGGDGGSMEPQSGLTAGKSNNGGIYKGKDGSGGNGYGNYNGGGGGGGGYIGGNGGNETSGSGGSSYTDPLLVTSAVHTIGYNKDGSGSVTMTPVPKAVTPATQADTAFKPHGEIYGSAFCDLLYKDHADTSLGIRSSKTQYGVIKAGTSMFQFRRINLGYRYDISRKFSSDFLLAAEEDYNMAFPAVSAGDLLANGKFAPFVKLANIRVKNIFKGTDLIAGEQFTPAFHYTSEMKWGYRSVKRTIADQYRTPEYDLGISLQGHLPNNEHLGYHVMVGNGNGAAPASGRFRWFYGDIYYKMLGDKLIVDLYADYKRLTWTPTWRRDRHMTKLLVAYSTADITIGIEGFVNTLRNDNIATKTGGLFYDTINTSRICYSLFVRGRINKHLGYFVCYDSHNTGGSNDYVTYQSFSSQSILYDQCSVQDFATGGIDYSPAKNVSIMPNIWYNHYRNITKADYGTDNNNYDLVYRLTIAYSFSK